MAISREQGPSMYLLPDVDRHIHRGVAVEIMVPVWRKASDMPV